MRVVMQRVASASVSVDGAVVSSVGRGLCVLVGIHNDDDDKNLEAVANKILKARVFDSEDGEKRWMRSVTDAELEVLCISQFTLYHTWKGNKPDFRRAMDGGKAREMYERLLSRLRARYVADRVKDGLFGAMMMVNIVNDGPVTVEFESKPKNDQDDEKPDA